MKKKAYVKNQIRIIFKTKARFLSIFMIVFLGASFFAGLRHAPMIMENSMNRYLSQHDFNDLEYIATLGFNQEDINSIKDIKGIDQMEVGMRFDALLEKGTLNTGITVYSRDSFTSGINTSELVEGKFPSKDTECVMDHQMKLRQEYKIGQTIKIKNNQGEKEIKIVGFINDPRYISDLDRGTNTLGDGSNEGFIQILTKGNESLALPQSLYDLRKETVLYNSVRITLKNNEQYNVFSDTYDAFVKEINYKIKNILVDRYDVLYADLTKEATTQLTTYQQDYDQGLQAYQVGQATFNTTVSKAKIEITNAKIEVAKNQKTLLEARQKMSSQMASMPDEIHKANEKLESLKTQLNALKEAAAKLPAISDTNRVENFNQGDINTFPSIISQIEKVQGILGGFDQLLSSSLQLEQASLQLEKANLEIQKSENELLLQELATSKQLEETKQQLDSAKEQLETAKQQIENIPKGNIITLTKNENAGIMGFIANSESISSLSLLFPLIFFLVAALVSLTTMTRMVEEQRVQSGTFRALGYAKKDVILQYIVYAFLATFVASVLGNIFGVYFFPWIIYFLYCKMLYGVTAPIQIFFDAMICLQTFLISVAITLAVTFIVCYQELSECPAALLRPKAPKVGKRIVLERIPFIWSRLSFNRKVTMRNIFRYKKRFFMSVIGIAGCTALIVTGFGLRQSVSSVVDNQYGHVWRYDGLIYYQDVKDSNATDQIENTIKKRQEVKSVSSYYSKSIDFITDKKTYHGNMEVPKDANAFEKYVTLNSYAKGTTLHLSDDGVMISAKIAEFLNAKVGDTITISIDAVNYEVKVSGIFEFYFMHYVYMSKSYYENLTGNTLQYNAAFMQMHDDSQKYQKTLNAFVNEQEELSGTSYVSGASEGFDNQIQSVNSVVVILIICAGALAFVVLYNLTNINIQERKSEIATIKVLGFYPKEVYQYVFRENTLLALIGSLVGLVLGKLIHMYLIKTVEVEMAMFVRELFFSSYILAIIITMLFTMAINFAMRKVLKKIDMVESLKSIE